VAFADYAMTLGPAGNLVMLWEDMTTSGTNGHYMAFDPASSRWSKDTLLFNDAALERSFAPVWDATGNLTVAYIRDNIEMTTKTVTLEGGQQVTIPNVPESGRVDLGVIKRTLVMDLGMQAGDLTTDATSFLPGSPITLTAWVRNLGDLAVINPVVAFYDGDPAAGGTEFDRQTALGWLDGSTSATVKTTWIMPDPAGIHTIYAVVDPDNTISEFNKGNNQLSLTLGGSDLAVTLQNATAEIGDAGRIVIEVRNQGAPATPATTLAIRYAGATGAPLATASIPALEPGRLAQVALDLPPGSLPTGETSFTVKADDDGVVSDVNPANNITTFAVENPKNGVSLQWWRLK
jgi:hypothetical protein